MRLLDAFVIIAALVLCGCGGGGGGNGGPMPSPQGSYNLQAAMLAQLKGGLTANVAVSGTAIANGSSNPVTGTGTWSLSAGATGMFNGTMAELQTQTLSGTLTVAGQTLPFSSSDVIAYEAASGAVAGESQSSEFDVAQAPIAIPIMVGTAPTVLGTLSRYADSTMSVILGTVQVSVAVSLIPVDPGSPEAVQFTYKIYDTSQALVETDTYTYNLTQDNVLSLNSAAAQSATGTLNVVAQ